MPKAGSFRAVTEMLPLRKSLFLVIFNRIKKRRILFCDKFCNMFGTENGVANSESFGIIGIVAFCSGRVTVRKGSKDEKEERNTVGDT